MQLSGVNLRESLRNECAIGARRKGIDPIGQRHQITCAERDIRDRAQVGDLGK